MVVVVTVTPCLLGNTKKEEVFGFHYAIIFVISLNEISRKSIRLDQDEIQIEFLFI